MNTIIHASDNTGCIYVCILLRIPSFKRACINNSYFLIHVVRSEDICHEDSECALHLTGYSEPTSSG